MKQTLKDDWEQTVDKTSQDLASEGRFSLEVKKAVPHGGVSNLMYLCSLLCQVLLKKEIGFKLLSDKWMLLFIYLIYEHLLFEENLLLSHVVFIFL